MSENRACSEMPLVSVVMPTYCARTDVANAVESVLAQTYPHWELLVINDFGSDDGTAEIVEAYHRKDTRVRLIQASRRLGLAESLNYGFREAQGKYIARLDADDTAHPTRFEKQVALMEAQEDVGICGTWQHHYGPDVEWIHRAESDEKKLICNLLFWCDLCHSTLMLRRSVILDHQLYYDGDYAAEDYELWTRAALVTRIVNIPEVLGEYKIDGTNITAAKEKEMKIDSGRITSKMLRNTLQMTLTPRQEYLISGWTNQYWDKRYPESRNRAESLTELKEVLLAIWSSNQKKAFFAPESLLQTLSAKWHWARDDGDCRTIYQVRSIEEALADKRGISIWERYRIFRRNNPKFTMRLRKILHRFFPTE